MLSQKNVMGMNAGSSISESRNALKGDNMSIKNVYAQIVSFDNLLQAEKDARAGKRYENEQLAFWGNLEDNIHSISEKLKCHNYPPDIYHHFYVYEPKLRKVIFSDYTTKVIQRAAYNVLNPIVCKGMISDTYSCIEDRGQLKSMQRLAGWVDFVEKSGERWYYLKMDVEKFFYRMDHEVLMSIIQKKIGDKEAVRFLEHYVCHASRAFGLPLGVKSPLEISDKEMLWDVGIAIGGGLSHMYGNMYLNPMDQMAKRKEGIQYYIRYMDDVIILSTDKELLHRYKNMFSDFLGDVLKLRLNNKTAIRPMQKLLYALANGTDKKRVGAYGCGLQERDVFETAILISGEKSIFTYTKEIGGLAVRVLEFPDIFWTKDDKESDRVKAIVRENYGHITHRVAELLLDSIDTQEETTLKNSFEKWDKKFVSYAKKNNYYTPITDRVSRVLALLMISLEVLEKVVDVKLNAKSVYGILCKTILEHLFFESEQDNLADKGYALLREFYINNKKNLDCDEARGMFGGQASDYKGSIINKSKEVTFSISDEEITTSRCLGITKLQAERILVKEGHLSSVKAVMTALRKKGALCTKSSGNNVRNDANPFVIGDEKVSNGYQIYMPEEVYQDVTDIDNETDEGKIKKLYA